MQCEAVVGFISSGPARQDKASRGESVRQVPENRLVRFFVSEAKHSKHFFFSIMSRDEERKIPPRGCACRQLIQLYIGLAYCTAAGLKYS